MNTEVIKQRLTELRLKYKTATVEEKKLLRVRGLFLKWALDKREPRPKLL